MVGMLVVVGAVHVNAGHGADCGRHAHYAAPGPVTETTSQPQASVGQTAMHAVAVALHLQWMSIAESDPCEQGECDHDFGGGCCAVACHAAVAGLGPIMIAAFQPTIVDPLMSARALRGKVVGPSDRPPRSA